MAQTIEKNGTCPCRILQKGGTQPSYSECCEPLHQGRVAADAAEKQMRARYSAFVKGDIDFLYQSYHPSKRQEFDRASVTQWARDSVWGGLEVLRTEKGGPNDSEGLVEFVAHFKMKDKDQKHHEIAVFRKEDKKWYFEDGFAPGHKPFVREEPKTGRNDPCPCGSGKKYKKCCA